MAIQNVEVLHAQVGGFRQGQVVSVDQIEGGLSEIPRLLRLNAVRWTDHPADNSIPLAASRVAEMDDDELLVENRRLIEIVNVQAERILQFEARNKESQAAIANAEKVAEEKRSLERENAQLAVQVEQLREDLAVAGKRVADLEEKLTAPVAGAPVVEPTNADGGATVDGVTPGPQTTPEGEAGAVESTVASPSATPGPKKKAK